MVSVDDIMTRGVAMVTRATGTIIDVDFTQISWKVKKLKIIGTERQILLTS